MIMALEQFLSEDLMRVLRQRAGRERRSVQGVAVAALVRGLKNGEPQKDLNDLPGSWADDPGFENAVLDRDSVWERARPQSNLHHIFRIPTGFRADPYPHKPLGWPKKQHVYLWADGIDVSRPLKEDRPCVLVRIDATAEGARNSS
jgi:hypothetical protein